MALADVITDRRSIRRYATEPVDAVLLDHLLTAACWAPSAHNRQPWRFAVLRDPTGDVARSHARITGAPVVLAICLTLADMDRYPDPVRAAAERLMAIQSTAMAVQNLLLAATEAGLGACWMCAPLFCPDVVRAALDLPAAWEPQALVTLGHPASAGKPAMRRDLQDFVRTIV
jgi:coenzyme F420-0:L-glutamate ligase/coenzyme F420-1:gamma-L-glutamate ligase